MKTSEMLRKLAADLRVEDARLKDEKRVKCAQIIRAARGLTLLSEKLGARGAR